MERVRVAGVRRMEQGLGLLLQLLEALRAGLWGTADVWGRIVTFKPS
jgi:hypothetical protein